ncbi:MAG TPA: ATP-grasp fold amidoligase family protein [Clostridia bacterium]|nr:ATP-grasp fold amidoligase family protein [Clostridia bacterium]
MMWIRSMPVRLFPRLFMRTRFLVTYGRLPDLDNPKSLYEKLIWINRWVHNPLMETCTDKLAVRDYVSNLGLGHTLNELISAYETPDDIDFDELPDSFVLKCTHGSGMNIVVADKTSLDIKKTRATLKKWMKFNYYHMYGEKQYRHIQPRIICEKYLGNDIMDYKVYCFNGKPAYIMLCTGRNSESLKWYLYDFDWTYIPFLKKHLPNPGFEKPGNLHEIYDYCQNLSSGFIFARVDFYLLDSRIVFGEITFTPSAFMDNETTDEINLEMGSLINLQG